jgi:HK97 family phage major capsid protein
MTIKEMQAERLSIIEKMRALTNKANAEKRDLTTDEDRQWNAMDADQEKASAKIQREQKQEKLDGEMNATVEPGHSPINAGGDGDRAATEEENKHVNKTFNHFVRFGMEGLNADDQKLMRSRFVTDKATGQQHIKAALTVTTSGGGFLIPQGFSDQLDDAIKLFGGMLQASYVFDTATGAAFPWPTDNDTSNVGELLGINTTAAQQDVTFGQVTFNAFKYSSKIVLVPIELLQDSYFDLNKFLALKLGQRIGRIANQHFTTGTGSGQPTGAVTGATAGKVGITGETLTVIYDDLVDLVHAVDPGYRMNPTARFMLADSSLKVIKKLKDGQQRPLWLPYTGSVLDPDKVSPDTIIGYPYTINQDMAAMAANSKSILFGDFDKYKIRRVMDMTLLRLTERYADVGQVGFLVFARYDGQLVDAGTHPIQYFQNSAT